ncbi:OsmC family protein [Arcticibacterium luteifluviistationis]|uniref:Osmotically inducible protein C n=1 Tax=Arcticibacterium luteifluviistationis TaxID=1784714 RepID=A0A2Z4GB02_9BACT|nr:OsmC family protein [Arcticibacterium luteifluviistationis]AWV98258.1 osmotically inducible protein C [Arcticibacterium luteifluviistationis]
MNYQIKASSTSNQDAIIHIKESNIDFGTTPKSANTLPNPAELFLGSFAACMLKNVERFSEMLKFDYTKATLEVNAIRLENPPRMDNVAYNLTIYSNDKRLNTELLKKNLEKFGTIFNTVKLSSTISGIVNAVENI